MKKLGELIRDARKKKQITQDTLALAIGVSDRSISAYESNRISPPLRILQKIAKETDQPMSFFMEEDTDSKILAQLENLEKQFDEIKNLLRELKKTK